jgi:hypothetical protein
LFEHDADSGRGITAARYGIVSRYEYTRCAASLRATLLKPEYKFRRAKCQKDKMSDRRAQHASDEHRIFERFKLRKRVAIFLALILSPIAAQTVAEMSQRRTKHRLVRSVP